MNQFDVRIAFPSGLARSYLDFLLSFDYPLRVLIPLRAFIGVETAALTFRTKQYSTSCIAVISVTANHSITISF